MYSWIWRHLPFGLPGRIVGSLVLVAAVTALMWYAIFPNIEQYMPFTDGQVTSDTGGGDSVVPSGGASAPADGVIPYSTASNNPQPSATR